MIGAKTDVLDYRASRLNCWSDFTPLLCSVDENIPCLLRMNTMYTWVRAPRQGLHKCNVEWCLTYRRPSYANKTQAETFTCVNDPVSCRKYGSQYGNGSGSRD